MSMSSLPSSPSKIVFPNTSSLIKDALSEERRELPTPLARRDFKDTLARLSAQHEANEEDNPESDTVYQALLKPIQAEEPLKLPHDILTPPQSFSPERPRTSPSKLALSVVLKPVAEHDDALARQRARLTQLAPLESDSLTTHAAAPASKGHASTLHKLAGDTEDHLTHASWLDGHAPREDVDDAKSMDHNETIETIEKLEDFKLDLKPLEEERARRTDDVDQRRMSEVKLDPQHFARTQEAQQNTLKTLQAIPLSRELTPPHQPSSIDLPSPPRVETGGSLLHNAVERTRFSERVTLSMENSPLGQKLELDIKDIFGNPLKLKITFEDQRARATCFGSQFHDPEQVEHVLDSVRTALEASGFELGDFIMHHHRDRRPDTTPHDVHGDHVEEYEATPAPKKEILRIVGIVNRIA